MRPGKDSAIKHVMSGVNPQGCQVYSFKHPSAEELDHDFLWRTTALPAAARTDRNFQPLVLRRGAHRPGASRDFCAPKIFRPELLDEETIWEERYRSINDLESHLYRNGTRILKFFLHVSKAEQRKRFLARLDDPEKNWKFGVERSRRARALGRLHGGLRSLPARDEQCSRALVCRPGGRQEKRAPDHRRRHRGDARRV